MSLIRLAYASEATFSAQPVDKGVEPNVARILMASRTNNAKSDIVGGLYYGDDRFFQYLEGEEGRYERSMTELQGIRDIAMSSPCWKNLCRRAPLPTGP